MIWICWVSIVIVTTLVLSEVFCNKLPYNSLLDEIAPSRHSAPVVNKRVKHEQDHYEYPRYKYGYSVHDPKTKDIKSAWEHRDGDLTQGEYSLVEPDGAIRIVRYTVNKKQGFRAVVDRIPPPQSKGADKNKQTMTPVYKMDKPNKMKLFDGEKIQSYYNPPKTFDFTPGHYQRTNIKDFNPPEKSFSPVHAEYQDFKVQSNPNRNQNRPFYSQQKESSDEDDEKESEEENGDDDGDDESDDNERKENPKYNGPPQQNDAPNYNFQSQSLQDMSDHYNMPFDFNEPKNENPIPAPYINHDQNPIRPSYGFNQIQTPFKPSQRDYGHNQMGFIPAQALTQPILPDQENAHLRSGGKTASFQTINYNTPKELTTTVIHSAENLSYSPGQSNEINLDSPRALPYFEDTYYPPSNGNYKYTSQPIVQVPSGKLIPSLNSPPAHSFPSTGHLLIPPQEKLPNYNENKNAQSNLPPPGTPISHNHHHVGEFDRYD